MSAAQQSLNFTRRDHQRAEQRRQIERVSHNIADTVLEFCRKRLASDPLFTVNQLHEYVSERHQGAPGSPDRILRDLKRRERVSYEVVSRSVSLYRVTGVAS